MNKTGDETRFEILLKNHGVNVIEIIEINYDCNFDNFAKLFVLDYKCIIWYFFDYGNRKKLCLTDEINYERFLFRVRKHGNVVIINVVETQIDLVEYEKKQRIFDFVFKKYWFIIIKNHKFWHII